MSFLVISFGVITDVDRGELLRCSKKGTETEVIKLFNVYICKTRYCDPVKMTSILNSTY